MKPCPACGANATAGSRPYTTAGPGPFDGLRVVTCANCGTGFTSPMPTVEMLDAYYRSGAYETVEGSELSFGTGPWELGPARARAQVQMARSHSHTGASWLDVGAGYGFLLDAAKRAGYRTTGVEPGPVRASQIVERGHSVFRSLDKVEGPWDVISLSHSLEHMTDPVTYLATLKQLLSPTGVVLCEVPNDGPGAVSGRPADEPHVVFFSSDGLGKCGRAAGLKVVSMITAGPPRLRARRSIRGIAERYGSRVLPEAAVPYLHQAFWTGKDRVWLRAVFR